MNFGDLRNALGLAVHPGRATLQASLGTAFQRQILDPFYRGEAFDIQTAAPTTPFPDLQATDGEVVLTGLGPFLKASLAGSSGTVFLVHEDAAPVTAHFRLSGGRLTTTIEFRKASTWKFSDSFPALPLIVRPAIENPASLEDAANLVETDSLFDYVTRNPGAIGGVNLAASLVLTSQEEPVGQGAVTGLSVSISIRNAGLLGAFNAIPGVPADLVLSFSGPVIPPGNASVATLGAGEHAWDRTADSGVHLAVDLANAFGSSAQLGRMPLSQPRFHLYSPLDDDSVLNLKAHPPEMGISGKITIPSAGVEVVVSGARTPGLSNFTLAGQFSGVTPGNLLANLADFAGVALAEGSLIPPELGSSLNHVSLKSLAVDIEAGSPLKVSSVTGVIGVGQPFSAGDGAGPASLTLDELVLAVDDPFSAGRSLSATLSGTATIGSAKFDALMSVAASQDAAQPPSFRLEIVQEKSTSVPLQDVFTGNFGQFQVKPPDIDLRNAAFTLVKQAGSQISKEFSASIAAGQSFQLADGVSIPHVDIAISDDGWRIDGVSPEGVSPLALFGPGSALAERLLGQNDSIVFPSALADDFKIASFSVFHKRAQAGPRQFVITCSGDLRIADDIPPLAVTLEAQATKGDGTVQTTFSGRVTAGGVDFALAFQQSRHEATSAALLVGSLVFSGTDNPEVKLSTLLGLAGIDAAAVQRVPEISLSLSRAFIAFRKTRPPAGSTAEKRVLLGIDLGTDIDLSSTNPSGIDLSKFGVTFDLNKNLSFRFLISSGELTGDALQEIAGVLGDAFGGLPEEKVAKGVTAALRIGATSIAQEPSEPATPSAAGPVAPTPEPDNSPKWFNVQKHLGPLHLKRIGAEFRDSKITLTLDAAISAAGLTLGLDGLSLTSPLKPFTPTFGLNGLSLTVQKPPISISGAFLRRGDDFLGAAVISTQQLTLSAVGGYRLGAPPSFFVFAALDYPIGGPNFFFITGLAGGFGYNRDIVLPQIQDVENFLFLRMLAGTNEGRALLPAANSSNPAGDVLEKLTRPVNLVPPQEGTYWFALGIRFKSFEIIESAGLLVVKFGRELEIALLGLSTLKLPKQVPGLPAKKTYLQAQLAFKVSIKPLEGIFAAQAKLTSASYVIDESCRLSGEFAFFVWFSPHPNAGDFVLTLGGYHPRFLPPAHYPKVEPLQINWSVNTELSVKGSAYFALTPSCVMAGGRLDAVYNGSWVQAYFIAGANFLIRWQPFYYDIEVFIHVGAHVNFDSFLGRVSFGIALSADLQIWGPEFSGIATLDLSVTSFDVTFGSTPRPGAEKLTWEAFRQTHLPEPKPDQGWTGPDVALPLCQVMAVGGLEREFTAEGTQQRVWIMGIHGLEFATHTAVPATEIVPSLQPAEDPTRPPREVVGIRPMGGDGLVSQHLFKLERLAGSVPAQVDLGNWSKLARRTAVPKEVWATDYTTDAPQPSADVLPNRLTGFSSLRPPDPQTPARLPEMFLSAFASEPIDAPGHEPRLPARRVAVSQAPVATPLDPSLIFNRISSTLNATTVRTARGSVIALAREFGFGTLATRPQNAPTAADGELPILAGQVETLFVSAPMLGPLGSTGIPPVQSVERAAAIQLPEEPDLPAETFAELIAETVESRPATAATAAAASAAASAAAAAASIAPALSPRTAGVPPAVSASTAVAAAIQPVEIGKKSPIVFSTPLPGIPAAPVARKTVQAGVTLVWAISHRDPTRPKQSAVRIEPGTGSVRINVSSRRRDAVADIVAQADPVAPRIIELPVDSSVVVITGVPPPASPGAAALPTTVAGWNQATRFVESTSSLFVANQVTVATQGSFRDGGGQDAGRSLTGAQLSVENRVSAASASQTLRSAGFETALPAGAQTLAVILQRGGAAASPGAQTIVETHDSADRLLRLQAEFVFAGQNGSIVLLYRVPPRVQTTAGGRNIFYTEATGGGQNWSIQGVLGIREQVARVRLNWAQFQLAPVAAAADEPADPVSVAIVAA